MSLLMPLSKYHEIGPIDHPDTDPGIKLKQVRRSFQYLKFHLATYSDKENIRIEPFICADDISKLKYLTRNEHLLLELKARPVEDFQSHNQIDVVVGV